MKNTGQGCISGFVLLGAVLVMSLLLVPVVIGLAVERGNALACLGVGVASVPYGLVLRAAGAAIAATRLRDRPSEIIIAVHPNR